MLQATHQLEDADEKGSLPQAPDETTILINIKEDDATRGDTAGKRGLARALKRRLGGKARIVFATHAYIRDQFPEIPEGMFDYDQALARFLAPLNPPQIVLGEGAYATSVRTGVREDEMLHEGRINENISDNLLNENELVTHHLAPEILDEHGRLFDDMHPGIKHPVLAIMLVDGGSRGQKEEVSKKVVRLMAHYPQATVYLCASRRTRDDNVDQFSQELNKAIQKKGLAGRLDVRAYKFSYNAGYNPYKGLIARARHLLVWGNSQSLVSEALYSGKTVYIYDTGIKYQNQIAAGRIVELDRIDTSAPPPYGEYEPVDIADQIAEKLLKKWQDKKSEFERLQLDDIQTDWVGDQAFIPHVVAAVKDMRALAKMPRDVLENKEFASYLVDKKPLTFRYFDAFWGDIDIAENAYKKDAANIDYLPEEMFANKDAMLRVMGSSRHKKFLHEELFARTARELWDEYDFVMCALKKAGAKIVMPLVGRKLAKNKDFFRRAVTEGHIAFADLPKSLQKERDLFLKCLPSNGGLIEKFPHFASTREEASECLKHNPHVYMLLPEKWQNDEVVAATAMEANIRYYPRMPEKVRENLDFAVHALKYSYEYAGYIPQKLFDDKESYQKLIETDISVIRARDSVHLQDAAFAKSLLDKNIRSFEYMLPFIRENLDVIVYALAEKPEYWRLLDDDTKGKRACYVPYLKHDFYAAYVWGLPEDLAKDDEVFWLYVKNRKTCDVVAGHQDKLEDDETCLKILDFDASAYELLPQHKKENSGFALSAIGKNAQVAYYVPETLLNNRDFLKEVIGISCDAFEIMIGALPDGFWAENMDILSSCMDRTGSILAFSESLWKNESILKMALEKTDGDAVEESHECKCALAENTGLALDMIDAYGIKIYHAVRSHLLPQEKIEVLQTCIGKDVTQAFQWLYAGDYYSESMMRAVVDLPGMRPEYLTLDSRVRAEMVVKLKPEWADEPAIQKALEGDTKKPEHVYITDVTSKMMRQSLLEEQHYTLPPLSTSLKEAWGKKIGEYINETQLKFKDAKMLKNIKPIPLPKMLVF